MQSSFTAKQLERRAATIIRSVRTRNVSPTSDALTELAEIHEALGDTPVKPIVIARMTVTRAVGWRVIVEVHSNATFHNFYHFYTQDGNRRSTKRLVHSVSRNEGLLPYYQAYRMIPGVEVLAERWRTMPGVTAVTVRIIKRRAYKKLISARPDQLGLTKMSSQPIYRPVVAVHS